VLFKILGQNPEVSSRSSPELNPLDFYLWKRLKSPLFSAPIEYEETFNQRYFYACQTILNRPRTFERVQESTMKRVHA
jgi:hypothetical protein